MKRPVRHSGSYLLGLAGGALVFAAAWVALILGQLGTPQGGSAWIDGVTEKKLAFAASIDAPKLVVVGGSNTLFGTDTSLLAEAYDRPAVNMGVNAGLRLPLVLRAAKPALAPGDIAILPLEYPMYTYDGEINATFIDYLMSHADLFAEEDLWTQLRVLAAVSLDRVLAGWQDLPEGYRPTGVYGPQSIDAWGDQMNTGIEHRPAAQHAAVVADAPETYGADAPADPAAWDVLAAFRDWAAARDICLIFVPPAFMDHPSYHDDPAEAAFYGGLAEAVRAHGLTFLGDPYAFMHPPEDFFDTKYHLVEAARTAWTERLIRTLGPDLTQHCRGPAGPS